MTLKHRLVPAVLLALGLAGCATAPNAHSIDEEAATDRALRDDANDARQRIRKIRATIKSRS